MIVIPNHKEWLLGIGLDKPNLITNYFVNHRIIIENYKNTIPCGTILHGQKYWKDISTVTAELEMWLGTGNERALIKHCDHKVLVADFERFLRQMHGRIVTFTAKSSPLPDYKNQNKSSTSDRQSPRLATDLQTENLLNNPCFVLWTHTFRGCFFFLAIDWCWSSPCQIMCTTESINSIVCFITPTWPWPQLLSDSRIVTRA